MYIHDTQHTSSAKSKEGIITYLDISLNFAFVTSFAFDNFSTFAIDVVCVSPGHTCVYLQSDPKSLWTPATTKAPHRQVEDCQAMVALLRSCLSLQDHNDEILRTGGQSSRE